MRIVRLSILVVTAALGAGAAAQNRPPLLAALDASGPITFYIAEGEPESHFSPGDRELAEWALEEWSRHSGGVLRFEPAPEGEATLQIHFVAASFGQYGEMRPLMIDGRRGAAVFIRPDTDALGPDVALAARADGLMRETVVYLTCLHELGHALGLEHTADFGDIMYFFGFGGDIARYFGRFRDQLETREDIRNATGVGTGDLAQLADLYGIETR